HVSGIWGVAAGRTLSATPLSDAPERTTPMSEHGDFGTDHGNASLEAVGEDHGQELDHQSQYGILEQDHHSYEHEEFEQLKHIEYTDAAGNHYEVTEYTHYEHTEVEDDHRLMAYGQESGGSAGLHQAGDF